MLWESEICVALDLSRVANVSTEHFKHFDFNIVHGANLYPQAGLRPGSHHSICQRCTRAISTIHLTILAPVMTPIILAQCPALCRDFRMLVQQVQTW